MSALLVLRCQTQRAKRVRPRCTQPAAGQPYRLVREVMKQIIDGVVFCHNASVVAGVSDKSGGATPHPERYGVLQRDVKVSATKAPKQACLCSFRTALPQEPVCTSFHAA